VRPLLRHSVARLVSNCISSDFQSKKERKKARKRALFGSETSTPSLESGVIRNLNIESFVFIQRDDFGIRESGTGKTELSDPMMSGWTSHSNSNHDLDFSTHWRIERAFVCLHVT